MKFTDAAGRRWTIQDYRVVVGKAKKAVPFGDYRSDGRAFIPDGWEGPVMLYWWGYVANRTETKATLLEDQLYFAKPSRATQGERMNGGG